MKKIRKEWQKMSGVKKRRREKFKGRVGRSGV